MPRKPARRKSAPRRKAAERTLDLSQLDPDPIRQFATWFQPRLTSGVPEDSAMTLATVTPDGRPAARTVLLKEVSDQGFVFHTNCDSPKGRQLTAHPEATLVFYWPEVHRQVIVAGAVSRVSDQESDAYFRTRPRGSQLGAWASHQSEPLESREALESWVAELDRTYGRGVPRPPHWGGFRLAPETIEFWQGRTDRLHDRFRYRREAGRWTVERLSP
jgi:pyridoxamine 5'-phosphate oxidase